MNSAEMRATEKLDDCEVQLGLSTGVNCFLRHSSPRTDRQGNLDVDLFLPGISFALSSLNAEDARRMGTALMELADQIEKRTRRYGDMGIFPKEFREKQEALSNEANVLWEWLEAYASHYNHLFLCNLTDMKRALGNFGKDEDPEQLTRNALWELVEAEVVGVNEDYDCIQNGVELQVEVLVSYSAAKGGAA